ncbi:MAG TPA: four helix bundle protein [Vicinamibacterales bacterium]|nr:four helix bundle protein [Vicinamibacterales bacterium]
MGQIRSYRDLKFGLCSQMQRAAVSIPSNIAESHGRGVAKGCVYFLNVAIGSIAELDTQLEAARRLRFVSAEQAKDLQLSVDRVRPLLYGLRREKQRQIAARIVSAVIVCL